jgi:hypothetical protein
MAMAAFTARIPGKRTINTQALQDPHSNERDRQDTKGVVDFLCEFKGLVFVRYLDHVQYSRASALAMAPQTREAVGWLVYECGDYITLVWDRDASPPTIHNGDPKASGLVLLKSDILELKKLG